MCDKRFFDLIAKNVNKCEVRLDKYILPSLEHSKQQGFKNERKTSKNEQIKKLHSSTGSKVCVHTREQSLRKDYELETQKGCNETEVKTQEELAHKAKLLARLERQKIVNKYLAFTEEQAVEQPKLCIWLFMTETEVNNLLKMKRKQIRQTIDSKLAKEIPKGFGRLLLIEMLYSVVRFSQKSEFNANQVGSLLPVIYLTHRYFLSSLNRSTREVYNFFKDIMLPHCFECPPDCMKIFNYSESANVAQFFCGIYIQNMPLIRILTLPNFGLDLNYEKLPDPFEENKGGKKGKK